MAERDLQRILAIHDVLAAVYADERFPPPGPHGDLRMLAVTAVWVVGVERPPRGTRWQRVAEVLHLTRHSFWNLLAQDAPRFEPDKAELGWADWPCESPMIRREGECGQPARVNVKVTDMGTGEWSYSWFCRRHEPHARQLAAAEREKLTAGRPPVPFPNTGGLLPCYLKGPSWERLYRRADKRWEPPTVGLCADLWPAMAKVNHRPPALRSIPGGREGVAGGGNGQLPVLLHLVEDDLEGR